MKGEPRHGKRPAPPVQPGRLHALRLAAGLTQHALARALGVSAQTAWLLDHDKIQPSVTLLRKLRRVLSQVPQDEATPSTPLEHVIPKRSRATTWPPPARVIPEEPV